MGMPDIPETRSWREGASGIKDHENQFLRNIVFQLIPKSVLSEKEDHQELLGYVENGSTLESEPLIK